MKQYCLSCLLLASLANPAVAASHGHGHVGVQGSIVDTACAIATGDEDQSIDLGTLAASDLINDHQGPSVPFTIHMVNCVMNGNDIHRLDHWKDVSITFDGEADGPHLFALQGAAKGEAVAIADETGIEAQPGEPMPAAAIEPGSMALHYRMRLTGDHHPLQPGRFHTTIRYFMEYD